MGQMDQIQHKNITLLIQDSIQRQGTELSVLMKSKDIRNRLIVSTGLVMINGLSHHLKIRLQRCGMLKDPVNLLSKSQGIKRRSLLLISFTLKMEKVLS